MGYRETSSLEIWKTAGRDFTIEFRCPQCGELLEVEVEEPSQLFTETCIHCQSIISVQPKLVLEWGER